MRRRHLLIRARRVAANFVPRAAHQPWHPTSRRDGWLYVWHMVIAQSIRSGRVAKALSHRLPRRDRASLPPASPMYLDDLPGAGTGAEHRALQPARDAAAPRLREPAASDPYLAKWKVSLRVPDQQLLSLPNGIVYGATGLIGPDAEHLVVDSLTTWRVPAGLQLDEARRTQSRGIEQLEGTTASLSMFGFANYAHWMLQGFGRAVLIHRSVGFQAVDRILLPDDAPDFVYETLSTLGVADDQLYRIPAAASPAYRCERLLTTTLLDNDHVGAQWIVEPLRDAFLGNDPSKPDRLLYVTREGALIRRVLNEAEVARELQARGFEVVTMDGRSLSEQAALTASARCVVGVHGAALANLVFARPGTKVLELVPRNTLNAMYCRLATAIDLDYDVLLGAEPAPPPRFSRFMMDADMIVNVGELVDRIDRLLAS